MVKMQFWQQAMLTITTVALSVPVISTATVAQELVQEPAAAPASLVGATRCAKQPTAIFSQRSATSAVVRTLTTNQRVTLSENAAQNGYIGVSAPAPGFVQTVNLRLCPDGGNNPPPNATCRRVSQTQGLIVRQGADANSPVVGSVGFNTQVFLTTNPATVRTDNTGRNWVQIAKPLSGWVSNGFRGSTATNLVNCQ